MKFPRGEYPITVRVEGDARTRFIKEYPGVTYARYGMRMTEDAYEVIKDMVGSIRIAEEPSTPPPSGHPDLRPYQLEGAQWLAQRGYGMLCYPPRCGKTFASLAATQMIDAKRVLVICPAGARLVWAREIKRWFDQQALLLYGRSGEKARYYGDHWYLTAKGTTRATPQQFIEALAGAHFTIGNFEILGAQHATDSAGKAKIREDLPGWARVLDSHKYDVVIVDETHSFRGWSGSAKRPQLWQLVKTASSGAERAWGLTGTPICSYPKDLWPQLQALSDGLYGYKDKPFAFHTRYCEGHKGEYGWVATGSSNTEELSLRLRELMLQPSRSDILPSLPPKQRIVIPIENEAQIVGGVGGAKAKIASQLMKKTLKLKLPVLAETVLESLFCGEKAIVYANRRDSAERVWKSLEKTITMRKHSSRLRAVNCKLFRGTGDDDCDAVADKFRNHEGAAVLVGTIDAWKGYRSLRGATSVHYVEYHFDPAAMLQSEDRPYEPDTGGLGIYYYIVERSIDEHIESILLPKIEVMAEISDKESANSLLDMANRVDDSSSTLDEVFASMEVNW